MEKAIEYGLRKPEGSEFDRRPNKDGASASYKFGKLSDAVPISGHGETQKKKQGGMTGHGHGGNGFGKGKGSVSSFSGSSGEQHQKKGFGGQTRGTHK